MKRTLIGIYLLASVFSLTAQEFKLNSSGYFNNGGVDVMSFNDFYPEGHQGASALSCMVTGSLPTVISVSKQHRDNGSRCQNNWIAL